MQCLNYFCYVKINSWQDKLLGIFVTRLKRKRKKGKNAKRNSELGDQNDR